MLNIHSDLVQKEMASIGPNAFCVLLAISSHISPLKRDCFPSRARIKKITGLGDEAVRNAIKKLSESGFLKTDQGRKQGAFDKTTYIVTTPHIGVYSPISQIEVTDSPGGGEPHPVDRLCGEPHPVDPQLSISKDGSIGKEKSLVSTSEEVADQSTYTPTKQKEKAKRNGAVSLPPAREDFDGFANPDMAMEIWGEWVEYKWEQHKERYKHKKSEQLMVAKLLQYSGGSIQKARAIIHDAMAKIYKGFFPYEDKMAASAIVPDQKLPEDTHPLTDEMQKRYESSTKKFYEECHLCAGIRWLSKKEYEKVVTKDSDFIGAMWYTKIPNNTFNTVVWDSLSELNKLPRWEKEKWKSVYEWLKKDVSDRVFGRK